MSTLPESKKKELCLMHFTRYLTREYMNNTKTPLTGAMFLFLCGQHHTPL